MPFINLLLDMLGAIYFIRIKVLAATWGLTRDSQPVDEYLIIYSYTGAGVLIMLILSALLYFVLQTPFASKYEIYVIVSWCIGVLVCVALGVDIWRHKEIGLHLFFPDLVAMFVACYLPVKFAINHSGRWSRHKAGGSPSNGLSSSYIKPALTGDDLRDLLMKSPQVIKDVKSMVDGGVKFVTTLDAVIDVLIGLNGNGSKAE